MSDVVEYDFIGLSVTNKELRILDGAIMVGTDTQEISTTEVERSLLEVDKTEVADVLECVLNETIFVVTDTTGLEVERSLLEVDKVGFIDVLDCEVVNLSVKDKELSTLADIMVADTDTSGLSVLDFASFLLDVEEIIIIDVLEGEFFRLLVEDKELCTLDDIMVVDTGT